MNVPLIWRRVREGAAKVWRATAYLGQSTGNDGPLGFVFTNFVLYQPESVLAARLLDRRAFLQYPGAVEEVCCSFFAGQTTPEMLDVVVVIKPGKRSRVWFVSDARSHEDARLNELKM